MIVHRRFGQEAESASGSAEPAARPKVCSQADITADRNECGQFNMESLAPYTQLIGGLYEQQKRRPGALAPIATEAPTSPVVWALFGVGAVIVIGGLALALRNP